MLHGKGYNVCMYCFFIAGIGDHKQHSKKEIQSCHLLWVYKEEGGVSKLPHISEVLKKIWIFLLAFAIKRQTHISLT